MHTSWKVHVRFTLVYISDVGDYRLKACWQYWLLCRFLKRIIQQYISSQTKQISNIWILTSLISKRCGHTFRMLECYYLFCLISVVGYQDQASSYVVLFERIDLKKELYLSLWSGRLYPTAVNQTQVDELPPSSVCLPANLSFTLPFFSSLSIALFFSPLIQPLSIFQFRVSWK